MNKFKLLWGNLRSGFWFTPTLIVVGGIVLAAALIEVDSARGGQWLSRWPRMFGAGADGARLMLSTLAGSMMSVMGITFSMDIEKSVWISWESRSVAFNCNADVSIG